MSVPPTSAGTDWFAAALHDIASSADRAAALSRVVAALQGAGAVAALTRQPTPDAGFTVPAGDHYLRCHWHAPNAHTTVEALVAVALSRPAAEAHRQLLDPLTSGLTHEINNPLAAVLANLELARRRVADQLQRQPTYSWLDELHAEVDDARVAAGRIHTIVKQLRSFHDQRSDRLDTPLGPVVDTALTVLGRSLRARGRLHRADPCDHTVAVQSSALTHAIYAWLVHVAAVVPPGQRNHAHIELDSFASGSHVALRARITGAPLVPSPDTEHAARGAARAAGIRWDAGDGWLTLGLPLTAALPCELSPQLSARVLIIDDEPLIGKAVRRMLHAHDVRVALQPEEGLELAVAEHWDVVLLDVNMPRVSGRDVYEAIAERRPERCSAVVFTTGGVAEAGLRDFLEAVPNEVLEKPFDHQRLRALVCETLESTG